MTNPQARNEEIIYRAALRFLEKLPAGVKVLDAPCGEGALVEDLKARKFEVWGIDIDGEGLKRTGLSHCVEGDLQKPLPFQEGQFDAILCVEGIEHLETPFQTIREFYRVLKPGGLLVLTTPNVASVRSRFRFFACGFFRHFPFPLNERMITPADHIMPLTYPTLRYLLVTNGFEIRSVATETVRWKSYPYLFFVPWILIYTVLALRKEKDPEQRKANWTILKTLLGLPILIGEHLILECRKGNVLPLRNKVFRPGIPQETSKNT